MYRIELAPGEETVFRTFEELATGVRNGFITSRARIYHAASQKWLPIEFHPHYKRALENPTTRTVGNPAAKPADQPSGASAGFAFSPGLFGSAVPATGAIAPAAPAPAPGVSRSGTSASGTSASDTSASGTSAPGAPVTGAASPVAVEAAAVSPHAASAPAIPAPATPAPVTVAPAADDPAAADPAFSEVAASDLAAYASVESAPAAAARSVAAPLPDPFIADTALPTPVTHSPGSPAAKAAVALLDPMIEAAAVDAVTSEAHLAHSRAAEAPAAAEDASIEEPAFLELVAASPVLELPNISYPEVAPGEEPVAHRPRTLGGGRRTLQLAGAAVVLVAAAYAAMSVLSPSRGEARPPMATVAERPAMPAVERQAVVPASTDASKHAAAAVAAAAPAPRPAPAPAPARLNPTQPASSGFAPALEPRALVSTAAAKAAGDGRPASSSDSSLAPAPASPDLVVPMLPQADSLVVTPRQHPDSAMKRILRAVGGGKDVPQR